MNSLRPALVDLNKRVSAPLGKPHRWRAVVTYRREQGAEVLVHDIEELWDLHMRIEQSFDFSCVESIVITMNEERKGECDTLEKSWGK